MPSFNQGAFIEEAVLSVLQQDYSSIELVIYDGQSTDQTIEVLQRLAGEFPNIRWTSERDEGPADALRKAMADARGEIIGWLNSDDLYVTGAIKRAVDALAEHPAWIMCYGEGEHIDQDGVVIDAYPTLKPESGLQGFEAGCFICQPTAFFKSSMLTLIGPLNTHLKTTFDYELWVRAFEAFPSRIGFVHNVQAQSRLHADCITNNQRETIALEGLMLGQRYLGGAQAHWVSTHLEELRRELKDPAEFKSAALSFLEKTRTYLPEEITENYAQSIEQISSLHTC